MAQQETPQSSRPVSCLPAGMSVATEAFKFPFVARALVLSIKKGLQLLLVENGCSSHMVDPATIQNAKQHSRQYKELRSPHVVFRAELHELSATGMAMLKLGVDVLTSNNQRSICLFCWYLALVVICYRPPQRQQTGGRRS